MQIILSHKLIFARYLNTTYQSDFYRATESKPVVNISLHLL